MKLRVAKVGSSPLVHGCVKASCEGALKKGYKVCLLKNGHTCWGADAKTKIEKTEHDLELKGVDIIEV